MHFERKFTFRDSAQAMAISPTTSSSFSDLKSCTVLSAIERISSARSRKSSPAGVSRIA